MTHRDHDRLFDPMQMPRSHAARQGGLVPDAGDLERRLVAGERYDDTPVADAIAIGWQTPNQGADQTVTATAFTEIDGATFRLSFAGAKESFWIGQATYRVVVASTGAADTDVYARMLIDWGDGTLREPDVDVDAVHGAVQAFGPVDYAESAGTGVALSLKPTIVFKARGGSSIRLGVGVRIGTAGQSAVIQADNVLLGPHASGFAIPYRRVR